MGLSLDRLIAGAQLIYQLDSFPIFWAYILMILLAGQWKKFTSPLSLRPILVVYNLTASVISLYTLYGFCYGLFYSESTFETRPSELLRPIFKIYWIMKIFELLDTVFMIVRHKARQISFLHVFHHASMLILSDLAYHYYPYPGIAPYLGLNSAVHVLLYFYYGLSALYPENPPHWKKFLTQFQIIQFFIDLVHAAVGYLYYNYCIYGLIYGVAMVSLFSNFYYKAYIREHSPKTKADLKEECIANGSVKVSNGTTKNMKIS